MRCLRYVFVFIVVYHISKHFKVEYFMDVSGILNNVIIAQTATL